MPGQQNVLKSKRSKTLGCYIKNVEGNLYYETVNVGSIGERSYFDTVNPLLYAKKKRTLPQRITHISTPLKEMITMEKTYRHDMSKMDWEMREKKKNYMHQSIQKRRMSNRCIG